MSFIKNHIVLNVFAAILTISIVIPSAVKFAHAFENHQHEVCTNFSTTHLHQLDIDCEFYKFKIPIQTFENTNFSSSLKIPLITNKVYNHYTLLKSLKFSLFEHRGPPALM